MSFETPIPPYNASDPHATYLNISCLDLLLIEMVPLAERMARRAERAERGELERKGDDSGSGGGEGQDGEVYRDAIFFRLDGLGYRVGQGLSERYVSLTVCLHCKKRRSWGEDVERQIQSWWGVLRRLNVTSTVPVIFCRNGLPILGTP